MTKHAIVSGGSIGGLFAASALLRAGWSVDIYERTEEELSGRGAGIVTHEKLINALKMLTQIWQTSASTCKIELHLIGLDSAWRPYHTRKL